MKAVLFSERRDACGAFWKKNNKNKSNFKILLVTFKDPQVSGSLRGKPNRAESLNA